MRLPEEVQELFKTDWLGQKRRVNRLKKCQKLGLTPARPQTPARARTPARKIDSATTPGAVKLRESSGRAGGFPLD